MMNKGRVILFVSLSMLAGCLWDDKPKKSWYKDHASAKQHKSQLKSCKKYLKDVHPNKQPTILGRCMRSNGYILKHEKVWYKNHASEKQHKSQLKSCKKYLKDVHPNKQPTILGRCMRSNGYILRRKT